MVNSYDGIKTEASIDYVMDTWNPECLRTVADWLNITKSILFRVYRRILVERLPTIFPVKIWSTYLFEIKHRWAKWLISDPSPKGTRWINDPSSDRADQWSNKSLSRVDLINHWSENGFARKEPHRSEILIRILSKERTLSETWAVRGHALIINEQKKIRFENRTTNLFFQAAIYRLSDRSLCRYMKHSINPKSFTTFSETSHSLVVLH